MYVQVCVLNSVLVRESEQLLCLSPGYIHTNTRTHTRTLLFLPLILQSILALHQPVITTEVTAHGESHGPVAVPSSPGHLPVCRHDTSLCLSCPTETEVLQGLLVTNSPEYQYWIIALNTVSGQDKLRSSRDSVPQNPPTLPHPVCPLLHPTTPGICSGPLVLSRQSLPGQVHCGVYGWGKWGSGAGEVESTQGLLIHVLGVEGAGVVGQKETGAGRGVR